MTGLYMLTHDNRRASVTPTLTQLDEFLDYVVSRGASKTQAKDLLTISLSFRAIDIIAGGAARMPHGIYRGETEVTEEIEPRYWTELNYRLCSSLLLFNAAYCMLESNVFGQNAQYRFLVTPSMKIETNRDTGKLTGFKYNNQRIDDYERRLLWWWWPNIMAEVGPGSGPTDAALGDASLVRSLTQFADAFFARGGFPITVLTKEGRVTSEDQEAVDSFWRKLMSKATDAFRAILLSDRLKPHTFGSPIKDTVAPDLYLQAARNVAISYGIPMSILLSDAANYATSVDDHVKLYTETIIPQYERMAEVWNERVFEPQGLVLSALPEELEIMQRFELQKARALQELVGDQPILDVDEARELLNYGPRKRAANSKSSSATDDGRRTQDWQRFARKAHNALADGKLPAVTFTSDVLLATEVDAARSQLADCVTHNDIESVFAALKE